MRIKQPERDLASQMSTLSRRDLQLWMLCAGVIVLITSGFLAVFWPNFTTGTSEVHLDGAKVFQLITSLLCLVAIFVLYVSGQRRDLVQARDALYRRLLSDEQRLNGLLDNDTQTYSQVVLQGLVERYAAGATPENPLSVLSIQITELNRIRRRNGEEAVLHLARALAEIMRSTLRGTDRICRAGEGTFVVVLPDTRRIDAEFPMRRLADAIARWNIATSSLDYRLNVAFGISTSCDSSLPGLGLIEQARETIGMVPAGVA
jgi:diguanylate cyclase (GGDEF)-like protein